MRMIKNHGSKKKYFHEEPGINSRLDAMQAAVLLAKLPHLNDDLEARRRNAAVYQAALQGIAAIQLPQGSPDKVHTWHQYTLRISQRRAEVIDRLHEAGIATAIYYPEPLHTQKAFNPQGRQFNCPVATALCGQVVSLPMYPELTIHQIKEICQVIKNVY